MSQLIRDKGDVPRLRVYYALASGTAIDPTSVTLTIRRPDLVGFTLPALQATTGSYYADLTLSQGGIWRYRFESTGLAAGVEEGIIFARHHAL